MIDRAPNSRLSAAFDRQALYAHADAYLEALAARDPSRLPWADRVVFTENNVQLAIGDGAWNTVTSVRESYDLKCADPASGEVAWFGIVEERGEPAIMALRLKVGSGGIEDAETIVCRSFEFGPFPSVETYNAPRPMMAPISAAAVMSAERRAFGSAS